MMLLNSVSIIIIIHGHKKCWCNDDGSCYFDLSLNIINHKVYNYHIFIFCIFVIIRIGVNRVIFLFTIRPNNRKELKK